MAEKKSIVIKLKYPIPGAAKLPDEDNLTPKTVTIWNIKRIMLALGGVIVTVSAIVYFYFFYSPNIAANKTVALPTAHSIVNVAKNDIAQEEPKKKVVRTQLTYKIVDSEPVGEIRPPIAADKKHPISVYYFAELVNMKGATVHHEWLLDDKLISKKTINISDHTWRTSSRQAITYTTNSNWTVKLVDDSGNTLSEKKFTVILKK